MSRREINIQQTRNLRRFNVPYREIGKMLAAEIGRTVPFLAMSVRRALMDAEKAGKAGRRESKK